MALEQPKLYMLTSAVVTYTDALRYESVPTHPASSSSALNLLTETVLSFICIQHGFLRRGTRQFGVVTVNL